MDSNAVTRTYLVISAAFSVISIPSAYMFGLSMPMHSGLVTLLDRTFFSAEIFRFGLLVVGVAAFIRPTATVLLTSIEISNRQQGEAISKFWIARVRFAGSILILLIVCVATLRIFLNQELILSFGFAVWWSLSGAIIFYVILKSKSTDQQTYLKLRDYLHKSLNLRSYASDQLLLVSNLTMVLVISVSLGYLRTMTLALSHKYCVETDFASIEAAIVGRTENGIVLANVENGDWIPITIPAGLAWMNSDVFSFVSNDQVKRISWACN